MTTQVPESGTPTSPAAPELSGRQGKSTVSRIREELRRRVMTGVWRPDEQIESEAGLVKEFGVCRATINKTLKELEREGLLVSFQGKGRFVATRAHRPKTQTLAVLIPDLRALTHASMGQSIAGIGDVIEGTDYHLNVLGVNPRKIDGPGNQKLWMGAVDPSTIDGAIVFTWRVPQERLAELAMQVPVVFVSGPTVPDLYSGVLIDFARPAFEAARHLVALGHTDIAVMTLRDDRLQGHDQCNGVRLAMNDLLAAGRGRFQVWEVEQNLPALARQSLRDHLTKPDRPTAIVCGSDELALGVYEVAVEAGLRIPQDLSITGFNDILTPRDIPVGLTTFKLDYRGLGAAAAEALLGMLSRQGQPGPTVHFAPSGLIVRDSTCPAGH
jgi:DNA-binding LacI/PurR family transcriptional regulator